MKYYYKIVDGVVGKLLSEAQLEVKELTEADMLADNRQIAENDDAMYKVFEACGQADKASVYGVYPAVIPALTETQRQAAKPLQLKQAENAFLSIVMQVPNVAIGDNSDVLTAKIEADTTMNETQKLSLGLKLLNAIHEVELQGGSWYDLPFVPHVLAIAEVPPTE